MAKVKGQDIYVSVNTGTPSEPTWTKVGGQKDATISFSQDPVDLTDKDSGGWKERELGNREVTVDFDSFLIEDDAGWTELKKGLVTGTGVEHEKVNCKIETPGYEYVGDFIMTGLSISGPNEDAGTVSFSLISDGEIAETAKA